METRVWKLIYGIMPPQVEHSTLAKKTCIKPYIINDMLHIYDVRDGVYLPMIHALEMYYLMCCFQICLRLKITFSMLGAHIIES